MFTKTPDLKSTIPITLAGTIVTLSASLFYNWDKVFPSDPTLPVSEIVDFELSKTNNINVYLIVHTNENIPVKGANVQFISNGAPTVKQTDNNGYASIEIPKRDDIRIVVSKEGFQSKKESLNLTVDQDQVYEVVLEKETPTNFNSNDDHLDPSTGSSQVLRENLIWILGNADQAAAIPQIDKSGISPGGVAIVYDPPSNVRVTPNGRIVCSVHSQRSINIYGS